eukprot:364152-Chlamydomonas_euryale.AAC.2
MEAPAAQGAALAVQGATPVAPGATPAALHASPAILGVTPAATVRAWSNKPPEGFDAQSMLRSASAATVEEAALVELLATHIAASCAREQIALLVAATTCVAERRGARWGGHGGRLGNVDGWQSTLP